MKLNQVHEEHTRYYAWKRQIEALGDLIHKINHQHEQNNKQQKKVHQVLTANKVDVYV